MSLLKTDSGRKLLTLLPEVYRNRDADHDDHLLQFLDAHGAWLDQIRQTLHQLLADAFPDNPADGLACQDWVLPYLAQLLDVDLVSPFVEGRRDEVANAVRWRQRKGTLLVIEQIAEAMGHQRTGVAEVEVQEGFKRVATTPRIGWPLLPATALGAASEPDAEHPPDMALHPGLPAVTPDLSRPSRAIRSDPANPAAHSSLYESEEDPVSWRHANPHGAPCFPKTYEDVSRRIVDLRTPDWRQGHYHPQIVLLFAPPPTGFFPTNQVSFPWSDRNIEDHAGHFREVDADGDGFRVLDNPTGSAGRDDHIAVTITDEPDDAFERDTRIEHLNFLGRLTVNNGRLKLKGVAVRELVIESPADEDVILEAVDCLFETVRVNHGRVLLEYCTILESLKCPSLQASDCILPDDVTIVPSDLASEGCIRYSRVPDTLLARSDDDLRFHLASTTTKAPAFFEFLTCDADGNKQSAADFGSPGCGVLHPATPDSICFGAEDGGEMGAQHSRRYCLQDAAVLEKLTGFLPLGIEAVLLPDARLLQSPPEALETETNGHGPES